MVKILVDNNKSRVVGDARVIHQLWDTMKLKAPGYFFSPQYRKRIWDGYTRYFTEAGNFQTGLIDQVIANLVSWHYDFEIEDQREAFKDVHVVEKVGTFKLRPYQLEAVKALLNNKLHGVKFIRGILHEATNAGKNLISAAIFESFSKKRKGLFLIDNSVIYEQALKEFEQMMPGQIGSIRSGKIKWGRVTICMVQSLGNLVKKDPKVRVELAKQDIILIDECDSTMGKKPCKLILSHCFNAPIRIGLSGTPLSHKQKTKNQLVQSFFGPVIHKISNKELVDQGYSSKPFIRIKQGNVDHIYPGDFVKEYRRGIIKNKNRNTDIWKITKRQIKKGRSPVLILIKNHLHIDYLMKTCPAYLKDNYTIQSVHHETRGREAIFENFKKGETTILIASMIIKRGKNLPSLKTLINAAGGDSETNVLQILGRGLRKEVGVKEKLWLYDFWDKGKYLRRHSFHRVIFYKAQGFPVKELYTK